MSSLCLFTCVNRQFGQSSSQEAKINSMVVTTAMNQSGTATWPAGQNCVGPHFAGKAVQTYWGLDLTRPLQVSSGIWHHSGIWIPFWIRLVCPAPSTEQDEATALSEYCFNGFSLASVSLGLWSTLPWNTFEIAHMKLWSSHHSLAPVKLT